MNWQVETENRFIEAAVIRAMEEKHESESKAMDLQQQVRWSQLSSLALLVCMPVDHPEPLR